MVGIFMNRRVEQQVVSCRVSLEIAVMDDYFPGFRFVQAVYL